MCIQWLIKRFRLFVTSLVLYLCFSWENTGYFELKRDFCNKNHTLMWYPCCPYCLELIFSGVFDASSVEDMPQQSIFCFVGQIVIRFYFCTTTKIFRSIRIVFQQATVERPFSVSLSTVTNIFSHFLKIITVHEHAANSMIKCSSTKALVIVSSTILLNNLNTTSTRI